MRRASQCFVATKGGRTSRSTTATPAAGTAIPIDSNLLLADGDARWLDDFGTGSYVDPSLHWYRSTLAHNAPLVNGVSQARVNGTIDAYDERGAAGWIVASSDGIAPPTRLARTVVAMSSYVIDELAWTGDVDVTVDLPMHADVVLRGGAPASRARR